MISILVLEILIMQLVRVIVFIVAEVFMKIKSLLLLFTTKTENELQLMKTYLGLIVLGLERIGIKQLKRKRTLLNLESA